MARELNAKVRDQIKAVQIAKLDYNDVKRGLRNLIIIRQDIAIKISRNIEVKENTELLNGLNDRIRELLIIE